jgi:DNA repair exonuclease SbcCD nuclease subunit
MVKYLFHIADLHFRTYKRLEESKEACTKFLEEVEEFMTQNGLKHEEVRIVIAGDVVHQKITISNELMSLVSWFFNKCSSLCPVIVIAGNHDLLENNMDRMDSITPIIEAIDNPNVHYYTESKCYEDDNMVWCVYSIFEENERPDIEKYREEFGNDKTYAGLFHAPVNGATTAIGYEFEESHELAQFEGCDIVLLGDIHLRQSFTHKGIPIAYSSSMIQQDFGEKLHEHGYLLWDVSDKSFTSHNLKIDYGYYVFKIESLDDIENDKEQIMNL